ncbi:MAG: hypothetical protein DRM99_00700 [Thermoplasmata archaeon]|nr:MAG: hypothetical protein DRM99_00700 [Thermoplasmata archaeon]
MEIIFHIGLHKTGTTFLQRYVFPKLKNVNLFCTDGRPFNGIEDLEKDKINLISIENLSGSPFSSNEFTRYTIMEELAKLYPNAKIIVTFRNKNSWLKSLYSQYIKTGGTYTYPEWRKKIFNDKYLDFEEYEKLLKEKFKEVLVLKFEQLKSNPEEYIKKICDFIGVDVPDYEIKIVGKKFSDKQLEILRIMNHLPIKVVRIYYFFDTLRTKKFFNQNTNQDAKE